MITYAPMTMDDYDEALALWQCTEGMGLHLSDVDSRAGVTGYLRRNAGMSLTARDGARLVGTVLCGHDGRRGYLHHLTVFSEYRRQGIGRGLLSRSLATLQGESIAKCNIFRTPDIDAQFSIVV